MHSVDKHIEIIDWGRTEYKEAFSMQRERVKLRSSELCKDALIFTEHDPIYTIGLRKNAKQHLIWSEHECTRKGINVINSNRGGDITYHGPGQIIGYPIVSIQARRDLHGYLYVLEEVVIRTLAAFGIESDRRKGKTGIWIEGQRKICAVGVAVSKWICYHGFALNVSPDITHYDGIVPCGITDGSVTSMVIELKHHIDIKKVKLRLAVEFDQVFEDYIIKNE